MNRIRKFLKSDDAIVISEYGLLLALVAIGLIAALTLFASRISVWISLRTNTITSV